MTKKDNVRLSESQQRVIEALRTGASLTDACQRATVAQTEVAEWLRRSERFLEALEGLLDFQEAENRLLLTQVDRVALQALQYPAALQGATAGALVSFLRGRGLIGGSNEPRHGATPPPDGSPPVRGPSRVRNH
jgi:hypothetical protein